MPLPGRVSLGLRTETTKHVLKSRGVTGGLDSNEVNFNEAKLPDEQRWLGYIGDGIEILSIYIGIIIRQCLKIPIINPAL